MGYDSIFEIKSSGNYRLEETEKIVANFESNFISNWNEFGIDSITLFLGGFLLGNLKPFENIFIKSLGCPNTKLCYTYRFYTIPDRNYYI